MILTTCAACAAPLAHDAPRCVRCKLRYCDSTCQHDHWRRGHKQMCKKIHRGGNAEQYNADKKYKEAVAVAVEACAADTKGQKCYICLEAVHSRTGEGLVRGCACGDRDGVASGRTGVAHVSCLAEQAKILFAEAEENNLDAEAMDIRWRQWDTCGLCEQRYYGVVSCALGWACWKTNVGRPDGDHIRYCAMKQLGNGLYEASRFEEALQVYETCLANSRRLNTAKVSTYYHRFSALTSIANCYTELGRMDEALKIERSLYAQTTAAYGIEAQETLINAHNLASSLVSMDHIAEAKPFLRKIISRARRSLGDEHDTTLDMRYTYARALLSYDDASESDFREAVTILEDIERRSRRVFGPDHPIALRSKEMLEIAREGVAEFFE